MKINSVQLSQVNTEIEKLISADSFYGKKLKEHGITKVNNADEFEKLFDLQNKGNASNWKPYVDVDIGVLSGGGVPGAAGTTLKEDNVAWLITQNIQDEMADVTPVLVSRNVDYKTLSQSISGKVNGDETTQIECGNGKGAKDVPFGNKAWVMIRKGGASQVFKSKYSKIGVVFNRQGFDNTKMQPAPTIMEL